MMAGLQLGGPSGTSPASSSVLSLASADPYDEAEDPDATTTAATRAGPLSGTLPSASRETVLNSEPVTSSSNKAESCDPSLNLAEYMLRASSFSTEAAEKLIDEVHKLQDKVYGMCLDMQSYQLPC